MQRQEHGIEGEQDAWRQLSVSIYPVWLQLRSFSSAAAFCWHLQRQRRLMAYRLASNRIGERIYLLKAFVTLHRDCLSQSLWLTGPRTSLAGSWPPPLSFRSLMP